MSSTARTRLTNTNDTYYHIQPEGANLRDIGVLLTDDEVPVVIVYEYPTDTSQSDGCHRAQWFDLSAVLTSTHEYITDDGLDESDTSVVLEQNGEFDTIHIENVAEGMVWIDYMDFDDVVSPRVGIHTNSSEEPNHVLPLAVR